MTNKIIKPQPPATTYDYDGKSLTAYVEDGMTPQSIVAELPDGSWQLMVSALDLSRATGMAVPCLEDQFSLKSFDETPIEIVEISTIPLSIPVCYAYYFGADTNLALLRTWLQQMAEFMTAEGKTATAPDAEQMDLPAVVVMMPPIATSLFSCIDKEAALDILDMASGVGRIVGMMMHAEAQLPLSDE